MYSLLEPGNETLYMIQIPYNMADLHTEFFVKIPWKEYRRIKFAMDFKSMDYASIVKHVIKTYTKREIPYTSEQIEILPAGIVDTLFNIIMYLSDSGTLVTEEEQFSMNKFRMKIDVARVKCNRSVDIRMFTTICSVFRAYTFESLETLPFDKICELFAAAEQHLLETGIITQRMEFFRQDQASEERDTMKTAMGFAKREIDRKSGKKNDKDIRELKKEVDDDDNEIVLQMLKSQAPIEDKVETQVVELPPVPVEKKKEPVKYEKPKAEIFELNLDPVDPATYEVKNEKKYNEILEQYVHEDFRGILLSRGVHGEDLKQGMARLESFIDSLESNIVPVFPNKSHPRYSELKRKEEQRLRNIYEKNIENFINHIVSGEFNVEEGFTSTEFNSPPMTDEEAMALAASAEILPAGWDILEQKRLEAEAIENERKRKAFEAEFSGKNVLTPKDIRKIKKLRKG